MAKRDDSADERLEQRRRAYWRGVDTLWEESALAAAPAQRGVALDRDQIVGAAIAIADRDGIEAVSMRRIAAELGSAPMSLYRHVPDKETLVSLMLDAALAEGVASDEQKVASGDWRADLRGMALGIWALMRRHPWYAQASLAHPPMTPRGVAALELALSVLDDTGLDIVARMQIIETIQMTVLSAAINAATEDRVRSDLQLSDEDLVSAIAPYAQRVIESGRYPRVGELFSRFAEHAHDDASAEMLNAIDLILDGIEARVGGRAPLAKASETQA